jgi:6-phosphogluconate dehydrogenase, C-terminal domain
MASAAISINCCGLRLKSSNRSLGTAEDGYLHCGPNGAGHFVKMVHNGIEYGVMAAYAEGLAILKAANVGKAAHGFDAETTPLRDPEHYKYDFDLPGHHRALAARQCYRLLAARFVGSSADQGSGTISLCRSRVRFRRGPLDRQGRNRRRRPGTCAVGGTV